MSVSANVDSSLFKLLDEFICRIWILTMDCIASAVAAGSVRDPESMDR